MVSPSTLPQHPTSPPKQDAGPPGPNALPAETMGNIEMPLPSNPQTFFLGALLALAVLAAVYVASSIVLPVALAFVLQLILQPAVGLLERARLPRALGALVAILVVIGALVGFVAALSVPAATWAEKLPQGIPRLETHVVVLKRPIEALQQVIQRAEHVADAPGKKDFHRFSSPGSWPDRCALCWDACRPGWPVYDRPGALFSVGVRRNLPATHRRGPAKFC